MPTTVIEVPTGKMEFGYQRNFIDSLGNFFVDSFDNNISDIVMGGSPFNLQESVAVTAGSLTITGSPSHIEESYIVKAGSMSFVAKPTHLGETIVVACKQMIFTPHNYEFWVGGYPVFEDNITPYLKLYTPEYQNYNPYFPGVTNQCSNKLLAFAKVLLQKIDDVQACAAQITPAFDLDQATGIQLDIVGLRVGAFRTLPFQPANNVSPVLTDSDFRILIKATIAANQWDGKIDSLVPIWNSLFPSGRIVVQDCLDISQTMTFNVQLTGAFSSVVLDMINHGMIIPRPEGVLINYFGMGIPLFGFDAHNTIIQGFDSGNWAAT